MDSLTWQKKLAFFDDSPEVNERIAKISDKYRGWRAQSLGHYAACNEVHISATTGHNTNLHLSATLLYLSTSLFTTLCLPTVCTPIG